MLPSFTYTVESTGLLSHTRIHLGVCLGHCRVNMLFRLDISCASIVRESLRAGS